MPKSTVHPLSWRLAPQLAATPTFFALKLPDHWKEALLQLELTRAKRAQASVPCDGLHRALWALVGDLISIERSAWTYRGTEFWLLSDREVSPEAIHLIVTTWAALMWKGVAGCEAALKKLRVSDLRWQPLTPDLTDWTTHANGTANPRAPHAFRLLPHYIAGALSRPDVELKLDAANRKLRRCPTATGAELMTWQPETYTFGKTSHPFCLTLYFSVQTAPFQAYPVVNCEVGVRLWKKPNVSPRGGNTSVYLCSDVPWLDSLHQTNSFQVAPLRWQRDEDGELVCDWSKRSHLVELLRQLNPQSLFPSAADVLLNSNVYGVPGAMPFAGVVHNTRLGPHPVGKGIFPRDLREIRGQLDAFLAPLGLDLIPQLNAVTIPVGFSAPTDEKDLFATAVETSKGENKKAPQIQAHRGANLPIENGGQVHFELFYQSENVRAAFEHNLRRFFGVAADQNFPHQLQSGGLLHFQARPLGAIGSELDAKKDAPAYLKRCDEIAAFHRANGAETPLYPTLSFVQIQDKEHFDEVGDPKNALRAGFAACGRLTQFIVAPNDGELAPDAPWNNAESALLDGIRQLGLEPQLPRVEKTDLPAELTIMGLWLFKNCVDSVGNPCGTLPAWLRFNSSNRKIEVKARGFKNWMPYREAQLALAHPTKSAVDFIAPGTKQAQIAVQVTAFVQQTLQFDVVGDTVIFCHAQNARSNGWKWLLNGLITPDTLKFLDDAPSEPLTSTPNWSGLRVIRVREGTDGEVPQHFAIYQGEATWTRGLYALGDAADTRVFASLAPKPVQFSNLSKAMSRWGDAKGKDAHNPRLLEITAAALQPNDAPVAWAALAHRLREATTHYRAETVLPWPLHLAMKIEEYVLTA